ncbi:MAG: bifunctional glycosyltransferase/class I SAM-dependent methyltransferase [Treponema sp.]
MAKIKKGVAVVVQCRLGSKRLPGKALLPLNAIPMARHVMRVVKNIEAERYILACDFSSYETLKPLSIFEDFECIEGDEEDVLSRFCKVINETSAENPIKVIVRVTADNPFIFVDAANASISRYFELSEPDYFTFTGLPVGSGVELLNAKSLLEAEKLTQEPYDREHVGPSLYCHGDKFKCIREPAPHLWYAPELRTTVDTKEDYERTLNMIKWLNLKASTKQFNLSTIKQAYEYATKLLVFYPSVKIGEGTGHLRRVVGIIHQILKDIRCAIYIKNKEQIKEVAHNILEELPDEMIVDTFPKDTSLIILDNFRTSQDEMLNLKSIAPVVAIDEGGARGYADFLLDILPSLKVENKKESLKYFANIEDVTFIPLPLNRKIDKKANKIIPSKTKVLVVCGGENASNMAMPVAKHLDRIGFNVSVVAPNLSFEDITKCSQNIQTYSVIENLRERLHEWDVVVTHYGFTAFEALVAGCFVLLLSPTPYHYKLGKQAGFTTIENPEPTKEDLKKAFFYGLKVPKIVNPLSKEKSLPDFIKHLFAAKKCNCPICDKDWSNNVVVRVPDKTVSYCEKCNIYYLSFIVNKQSDYSASYFFDEYKAQYGKTYLEDFENIKKLGLERMKHINAVYNEIFQTKEVNIFKTEKKLLDIGCAYGPFLEASKQSLWQPIGTDICREAVEYVNNTLHTPAFVSAFPAMPDSFEYTYKKQLTGSGYEKKVFHIKNESFMAVTMWYVIEHFQDLDAVLQKVASLLIPGGIFAFSTPNLSGITGKQSIYEFAQKSPIDHYSIWDSSKVIKVLEKYNFKVCRIVSVGHHPERFKLPFKIKKGGLIWKTLDIISKKYGLGDGMEVYCMKCGTID